jgi:hypothetical protein
LCRGGAHQHPVERRAAGHDRRHALVLRCGGEVLDGRRHLTGERHLVSARVEQRVEHVGQAGAQDLQAQGLQDVRERDLRRRGADRPGGGLEVGGGRQVVALQHGDVVPAARQQQPDRQPRRAAADHEHPHLPQPRSPSPSAGGAVKPSVSYTPWPE